MDGRGADELVDGPITADPAPERTLTKVDDGGPVPRRTLLAFAVAAVALVIVPLIATRLVDRPEAERYVFEIPAGTADAIAAGEPVEVIPADLDLKLDDRLVLVNNDDKAHRVGAFTVAAGETLERRFSEAASFSGFCSLHSDNRVSITIR